MTKIAFNKQISISSNGYLVIKPFQTHSVGNLNLGNRFECLLSLEVNINLIFGLKMSIFWNLVKTLRICYYSVMEVVGLVYSWPIMNLNMAYNLPHE